MIARCLQNPMQMRRVVPIAVRPHGTSVKLIQPRASICVRHAELCSRMRHSLVVAHANRRAGEPNVPAEEPDEFEEEEFEEFQEGEDFLEEDEFQDPMPGSAGNLGDDEFDFEEPTPEMLEQMQAEFQDNDGDEEARQERLRMAQEAASSSRSDEGGVSYPEPEERGYYLSDLYGKAAYVDAAEIMDHDFPDAVVYGLQTDPEKVIKGDLYICIPASGDITDAAALMQIALENGAAALLLPWEAQHVEGQQPPEGTPVHYALNVIEMAQRLAVAFYDAPARDLMVVGVAGSHGKTTVSWLICGILEAMDQITGTINSIGYSLSGDLLDIDGDLWQASPDDPTDKLESSVPFRITPYNQGRYNIPHSTPPGLQMQKLLAGMRDRGATCAVVECSNAGLELGHCRYMDLSVAVHTSFSDAGVDSALFEGDRQKALEAQLKLFDTLLDPSAQAAVVNLDDPMSAQVMERTGTHIPTVTYGIDNTDANVVAESARFTIWESEIIVKTPMGKLQIITPLLGKHNVYNILAAVATGIALKVPLMQIVAGIEAVEVIPGRCEVVDEGQSFSVIVDAADTPEALDAMLSALRGNAKNIFTVFGCRGEEDRSIRSQMVEVAHAKSDFVLMTNDSPRREAPERIMQDMVSGLPDEIVNKYNGYVYFPFQDQGHVPLWFEPYLQKAQRDTKRYIMEDRFSAIRAAIGTAGPNDVVVIAGRGHSDCMEYWDGQEGIERGWFDDRVEARSALQKLSILQQLDGKLDRKTLPWGKALDQMDTIISV